ncbi:merozoite surface protein 7 [Plasmodium sp. DRC-Itaito]|nr:merozoite surface protein 7 [Plasmodium sp. DRC-Itaito]
MKSSIIFYFSFFFVYLYYVSCNPSNSSTSVNNDEDQEELYVKNKKFEKLKSIISGDFVGNYKNNEELLKKKIEQLQNSEEKNVQVLINGNTIIDEIEKNNDNEENNDKEDNDDDDITYELDMNDDTFLGQNNDSKFENVEDESEENEQSEEENENSQSFPLFQNLGLFGTNFLSKVKGQSETHNQSENQQDILTEGQTGGAAPAASASAGISVTAGTTTNENIKDPNKKLYSLSDVLNHIVHITNKKNKINVKHHGDEYLDFKKKYEDFVLNSKEYDIIKNLLMMLGEKDNESNPTISDKNDRIINVLINALDRKNHEQFQNFIYGIYSYAKQNSHLNEKKIKPEDEYKKFFENSFNLLNTL